MTSGVSRAANTRAFLEPAGTAKTIARYARGDTVFRQGDACKHVLYIQTGGITLSVVSKTGRKAVVATLGPGIVQAAVQQQVPTCTPTPTTSATKAASSVRRVTRATTSSTTPTAAAP